MSQLLIKGGKCVIGSDVVVTDLLVDEGKIVAIGSGVAKSARTVIEAAGRLVLPGGVDVHVHLPWPKGSHISSDDFNSGTLAAAFGGVTSVIDFVIPDEEESLQTALQRKLEEARFNAWVDYSAHLNLRGDIDAKLKEVEGLVKEGFPSFKVFMAYEGFRVADEDVLRVMKVIGDAGGMMSVHAENGILADYLTHELLEEGKRALSYYPQSRPALCELESIQRLLAYEQRMGTRLHIHHVSTGGGAEMIGQARRQGLPVTGETCPQYLLFTDLDYTQDPKMAAYLVCAPSIKSQADQEALWRRLADGSLTVLGTDHCPFTKAQNEASLDDFSQTPGGLGGVETRLPLIFSEGVLTGRLTLEKFVEVWASAPARAFGLYPRKGSIAVGSDADLVIFDPQRRTTLRAFDLHSQTDCTPYEGRTVAGLPLTTILRGNVVVDEGKLAVETPGGELIQRYLQSQAVPIDN